MLLAVDVGNSNITFGVYEQDLLRADWRMPVDITRTPEGYAATLKGQAEKANITFEQISGFAICSVVPRVTNPLLRFAKTYLKNADVFVLSGDMDLGLTLNYDRPADIGADRVANVIAAGSLYPQKAVIVVDVGTATTFEAVSESGDFLGGAIAPGIETSADALAGHTSQLRKVPLEAPPKAIGNTTVANLQSGIIFGFAGQVDGIVGRFQEEMASDACVVATGGLAGVIAPYSRTIQEVRPMLTLEGLRVAYERYAS